MRNEEQIGYQIKELSRLLDKNIWQKSILNAGVDTVTATHGWMIGYLYHHRDREIFQKDMEADFHMAKSSVTAALQSLDRSSAYVCAKSVFFHAIFLRLSHSCLSLYVIRPSLARHFLLYPSVPDRSGSDPADAQSRSAPIPHAART